MGERYAVVSCHVERALDDDVWSAFETLQARAPGGFRIAALMRPPDTQVGEGERLWLDRAQAAAARAPLGHHTHFGGPETARPAGGDPVARFEREADWLRDRGLAPRFFCGGGWYLDRALAEALAARAYVDCSAVAFPLPWLGPGEPVVSAVAPCRLALDGGASLLELPSTHSLGALARSLRLPAFVHVHFHDWELVDKRRRAALVVLLQVLARRARVLDLDAAADLFRNATEQPFADAGAAQ